MKLAEKRRDNPIVGVEKGKKFPTLLKHELDTLRRPFWYDGCMLEGKCPKCGTCYFGWALRFPRNQICSKCGAGLEITEDGHMVSRGYTPFTAKRYFVKPPTNVSPSESKEKDSHVPNE